MPVSRWRDAVVGAASAVVVFAAVPAVLVLLVGSPLPRPWRLGTVVSWHGLLDLLAVVAWATWALCCWPIVRKVARRVRAREVTSAPEAGWTDRLAARIAAGILVVAPLGVGMASAAGAAVSPPTSIAAPAFSSGARPPAPAATPVTQEAPPTGQSGQYVVQAGDSLWSIANALYGDGADWEVLATANLGRVMADGTEFSDPSLIRPGWVLAVPAPSGGPVSPLPAPPAAVAPDGAATLSPGAPDPLESVGAPAGSRSLPDRVGPPQGRTASRATATARGTTPRRRAPLPELAALGLGAIVAAAVARRARRARLTRAFEREEGEPATAPSEFAGETAALVTRFEGTPALEWLERANRHLGLALAGRSEPVPPVVALRMGAEGVLAVLGAPVDWTPGGWEAAGDRTWRLRAPFAAVLSDDAVGTGPPAAPVLVPVGEADDGSWFCGVERGGCLPVLGAGSEPLVAAMVVMLGSWSWSGDLPTTSDPEVAAEVVRAAPAGTATHATAPVVVFVGDPEVLPPDVRRRAAVLTNDSRAASHLLVAVDGGFATLHPLGVTVRAHRLDSARREALAELIAEPATGLQWRPADTGHEWEDAPPPTSPASTQPSLPLRPPTLSAVRRVVEPEPDVLHPPPGSDAGPTPAIEVRLLVPEPRLEGLAMPLAPKRARRATEVVAYLALHHPEPVTGDRLRTRVLGSPDADAASKTLFNTVGAARQAMGADPTGRRHFPAATKAGHYRLGPHVTTDVHRAVALIAAAEATGTPDECMALFREALGLVEGEPLSRVYSGYGWWRAEGHERRIGGQLVDAACRLARVAGAAGHTDLARWGIEQARLVEPYSEALCRAAMRVAAAAGDMDQLRQEWLECRRRVDELDPGSVPSESTEQLYEELRRGIPSGVGRRSG